MTDKGFPGVALDIIPLSRGTIVNVDAVLLISAIRLTPNPAGGDDGSVILPIPSTLVAVVVGPDPISGTISELVRHSVLKESRGEMNM